MKIWDFEFLGLKLSDVRNFDKSLRAGGASEGSKKVCRLKRKIHLKNGKYDQEEMFFWFWKYLIFEILDDFLDIES